MTKDELKEKIKVLVKQVYQPDFLQAKDKISLDAPKFPILQKFPSLNDVIVNLFTTQYEVFIQDIQWVAPRPTTFRIILTNGEPFFIHYTPRSWIATIEGKKYYLANIGEEEQAVQSLARVLSYGQKAGTEEATGETVAAGEETPAEEAPAEETPTEEPAPEEEA